MGRALGKHHIGAAGLAQALMGHRHHGGLVDCRVDVQRILDFAIRVGPHGDAYGANPGGLTLEALKAKPHGVDMGALDPRLDEVLAVI